MVKEARGMDGGKAFLIQWNFRTTKVSNTPPGSSQLITRVNAVAVSADSLSGRSLKVWGPREKVEILTEDQWRSPGVLEDAIILAYNNPMELFTFSSGGTETK